MTITNGKPSIAFVSTYPPRECGIATFTRDLTRAMTMRDLTRRNLIVPIENDERRSYPGIPYTINQHEKGSYRLASEFLNGSDVDVLSLQHEFGIFGGDCGEYVLDLCRSLKMPFVTTFHTVLRKPTEKVRRIVREISLMSSRVVVTIESAAKILTEDFRIKPDKIVVIHHGASPPDRQRYVKRQLGLQKRTVLATHGLISSSKGIEFAIKALSSLVDARPNLLYLVIGETHPEVRKSEGEAYRNRLIALTQDLQLTKNVRFVNQFLRDDDLSLYLQAVDIYLAPYLSKDQVSSGTITLALSHGKAVVSTPTIFAKEILYDRGLLCKFANAPSIADCVRKILKDSNLRHRLEANALSYGQSVGWTRVADEYDHVFRFAIGDRQTIAKVATIS